MKHSIRAFLITVTIATAQTHVHAIDSYHSYTKNEFTYITICCANSVRHWYYLGTTNAREKLSKFCTYNPIFQWLEGKRDNDQSWKPWKDENLGCLWEKIRANIWSSKDIDRIMYFGQFISLLLYQIDEKTYPQNIKYAVYMQQYFDEFTSKLHVKSKKITRKAAKIILNSIFMYDPMRNK